MGNRSVERKATAKGILQDGDRIKLVQSWCQWTGLVDKVVVFDCHCAERKEEPFVYFLVGKKCRYRERFMENIS
jgi:hypothetical protein